VGFEEWLVRLMPGVLAGAFFVVAFDWLQTRGLNARRHPRESDDQVTDELAVAATHVYLAALQTCADLGWEVHAADDAHYTLWAINHAPHPGLRNIGLIVQMTPFGSGETRVLLALNSPHPAWVRRRFRGAAAGFTARLRLHALEAPASRE
jgi:hypothetical protein